MRRILVQIGADGIFEGLMKRASKHNCLPALILHNEAEGTRTLNLRIDSPMLYPIELRPRNLNHKPQYTSPQTFMSTVFMQNRSSKRNCLNKLLVASDLNSETVRILQSLGSFPTVSKRILSANQFQLPVRRDWPPDFDTFTHSVQFQYQQKNNVEKNLKNRRQAKFCTTSIRIW